MSFVALGDLAAAVLELTPLPRRGRGARSSRAPSAGGAAHTPAGPESGPALGTNDGICSPLSETVFSDADASAVDLTTGELLDLHWGRRLQKWEMQAAARQLLPESRLRICYRHRQKTSDFVRVYRRGEAEKASTYYRGLQVCGSVWTCPVCSAKVIERKRKELIAAMTAHRAAGGGVMLLTLTVPHTLEHRAFEVTDNLLAAFWKLGQGKTPWTGFVPGYVGSVRSLEVTHGANGWHPHLHVLVFTGQPIPEAERLVIADQLFSRWASVTARVGFQPVHQVHGLRLDDGSKAGEYATKWGFAEELTKANVKQGRRQGSRTPWELLADYTVKQDRAAGALFVEFAHAFKGKSQLHWSRGLRDHFGLTVEKSDQDLAAETVEAEDLLVARISPASWSLIRRHELRGLVLELLRSSGWDAVLHLLDQYRGDVQ